MKKQESLQVKEETYAQEFVKKALPFLENMIHRYSWLKYHLQTKGIGPYRVDRAIGSSTNYYDTQEFSFGDDSRRIDWKRSIDEDKDFIKLYQEETTIYVHVLLDARPSMWINPEKWKFCTGVALAFLGIALATENPAKLTLLGNRVAGENSLLGVWHKNLSPVQNLARELFGLPFQRAQKQNAFHGFRSQFFVADQEEPLGTSLQKYTVTHAKYKGLAFIVSGFDDINYPKLLQALTLMGQTWETKLTLVHSSQDCVSFDVAKHPDNLACEASGDFWEESLLEEAWQLFVEGFSQQALHCRCPIWIEKIDDRSDYLEFIQTRLPSSGLVQKLIL